MTHDPAIHSLFDPRTGTVTHVVHDPSTRRAAIIDPVLDFNARSGHSSHGSADAVLEFVERERLIVDWILETHAHADHLSAAHYLKARAGGRIAIGERIREVQAVFASLFNLEAEFVPDGRQFDHLFTDGERFRIGELEASALFVPGHTPADIAFLVGDAVFVGDTLFMPDLGSARADFPGGDARSLYRSMRRLLALPPATRLFMCHDYPPAGRGPLWETTVAAQRATNIHVRDGIDEGQFVALRNARDATLDVPELILPSLQVNVRAGRMPPADANGVSYLRIPLDALPTHTGSVA